MVPSLALGAEAGQVQWHEVGAFWMGTAEQSLHILAPEGHALRLSGTLADAINRGASNDPVVRAVASKQAVLAGLLDALAANAPRPLTRASLMRGTGFHTLFVELTAQCNERCVHCYAEAAPERTEALPWSVVSAVVEDAVRLGFERVQFTGGDPLIAPTLLRAVAHAHAVGVPQIELYTNGLALTDSLLEALVPFGPHFAFSMYSHDPDKHDAITRVPGSHARTLRAVRSCVERSVPVRVGSTLLAHTADDREELRALLERNGVAPENIGFVMSHAVGRGDYVEGDNDLGQHGGGVAALGAGKACVIATGEIVPCIFARSTVLGNTHVSRLYDVLTAPVPVRGPYALDDALQQAGTRLSCAECRLRDVFLAPSHHHEPLVTLRRHP